MKGQHLCTCSLIHVTPLSTTAFSSKLTDVIYCNRKLLPDRVAIISHNDFKNCSLASELYFHKSSNKQHLAAASCSYISIADWSGQCPVSSSTIRQHSLTGIPHNLQSISYCSVTLQIIPIKVQTHKTKPQLQLEHLAA